MGIVKKVYATSIVFKQTDNYICDNNNVYNIYNVSDAYTSYFFINPSVNYNLDHEAYHEIPFDSLNIDPSIKDFTGNFKYLFDEGMYKHLSEVISKMIWDYLYKDNNYWFCDKEGNELSNSKLLNYPKLYNHITSISNGLDDFNKDFYLKENEEYEYEIENINNYYIYDSKGLDLSINDNKLKAIGSKGKYDVILKKNPVYFTKTILLTDGINYLLSLSPLEDKDYHLKINIGFSKLTIKNSLLKENVCYDISQDLGYSNKYCTDKNGIIDIYLENGDYKIKQVSNIGDNPFEKDIYLNDDMTIDHNVEIYVNEDKHLPVEPINENINNIDESEEYISIIPKDTFSYKYLKILFLLIIGIYFAKKIHK